jgi:hypothetical protein
MRGSVEGAELEHFPFALTQFVIAGLDPAIHLLPKKMDPRVKPAGDDCIFKLIGIRSKVPISGKAIAVAA